MPGHEQREAATGANPESYMRAFVTVLMVSAALYFGRIVFEPIAFVLFVMALVEPFQKAAEIKMGKTVAVSLTILLTLLVLFIFVVTIVWSISEVAHWGIANVDRFQSLYSRASQKLEAYGIFTLDLSYNFNTAWFVGIFQTVAIQVNYFLGFSLVVFLFLMFGLAEINDFKIKLTVLDQKLDGWSLSDSSAQIGVKIRKYMLIRTLASAATGLAVFIFAYFIGLELAVAWGVVSFVLNYIPYIGSLIAVILPVIFATAQFESWQMVIVIFGILYFIQFIIGSYLEPVMTGNTLAISPFVMLFAFLIWDFLWGMPGAFVGLHITIALFTVWERNPSTRWIANLMAKGGEAPAA